MSNLPLLAPSKKLGLIEVSTHPVFETISPTPRDGI